FTLDELASIQPGYMGPDVMHVNGWAKAKMKDGDYSESRDGALVVGAFKHKQMTGAWTRTLVGPKDAGKVVGSGTFKNGAGTWTTVRADGTRMATGGFRQSRPEGTWTFFYRSGRVAAIGAMHKGQRDGEWRFFYDADKRIKLATGTFEKGETVGRWKHFDPAGKLVATSTGRAWAENMVLDVEPGTDGVRRTLHEGMPASNTRLELLRHGTDRLYVLDGEELFDDAGNQLMKTATGWQAHACGWPAKYQRLARAGDVSKMHLALGNRIIPGPTEEAPTCPGAPTPVDAARAARLEALLASAVQTRAPIPVVELADPVPADPDADTAPHLDDSEPSDPPKPIIVGNPADMASYLADNMTWYFEWPHVDGPFVEVYASLPGYHFGYEDGDEIQ
ncbi:MAG: hypothetical protein K8W52_32980, partial [Deltaproteobacteria bacterium]|nr:hypothetical protein [Deltaproteobacteria bacterium]